MPLSEDFMMGYASTHAPQLYRQYQQQKDDTAIAQAKAEHMQALQQRMAEMLAPLEQAPINQDPNRKAVIDYARRAIESGDEDFMKSGIANIATSIDRNYTAINPTDKLKDVNALYEMDPTIDRAKTYKDYMLKPNMQFNMGRAAPPTGYMYPSKDSDTLSYIPGGPADPDKKSLTGEEGKATAYYSTSKAAADALAQLYPKTNINKMRTHDLASSLPLVGKVAGMATNSTLSAEDQMASQAESQFLDAVNRFRSGASLTEYDIESANKTFFEQPNDKPENKAYKAKMRQLAVEAMQPAAGLTRRANDTPKIQAAPTITDSKILPNGLTVHKVNGKWMAEE